MNENTSQLRRIILSVFAIMIAGIVWAFTPVGIPGKFVKVNPDSVFYLNAPSAKAIYDYSDANAVNRITILQMRTVKSVWPRKRRFARGAA